MYSDSDLNAAVKGGAITADAAEAFRSFMASSRSAPGADEESFRLLTGFNDIFVTVAVLLVLVATVWLTLFLGPWAPPVTAAVSWGLAEYFTRRRRMALPSIVLLLSFVGAAFATAAFMASMLLTLSSWRESGVAIAVAGLAAAGSAYVHWRRFRVPITAAAGTLAFTASIFAALLWAVPAARNASQLLLLASGVGVFAVAMWWDASDRQRVTRRSDTAFWLHLLAAPMIVHPVFTVLGLLGAPVQPAKAAAVVACYLLLAVVALVVDRRAILVSALSYVLWATASLLSGVGALSQAFAVAALGIGGCLLLLSAFWQNVRRLLLPRMSGWVRDRVPAA